jgi:hypothetical protein
MVLVALQHQKVTMKDTRVLLLSGPVWGWHPVFCSKHKEVFQAKPIIRSPINNIRVGAVHFVIMDDVLALENHDPTLTQNPSAFCECLLVMGLKLIVPPVTSKSLCHDHPAITDPALSNIRQKRWVEYGASYRVIRQRQASA